MRIHRILALVLPALLVIAVFVSTPVDGADTLKGDEAKAAKDRLRDIKRAWKDASKAEKLVHLRELSRLPERTVGKFLEDTVEDEADDLVAERAAWALVKHGDPEDGEELVKIFKKAKTPERRAACLRWLGQYGEGAPVKDLKKFAYDNDDSAAAAVKAFADINDEAAWTEIDGVAQSGENYGAQRTACALLLGRGDKRGVEALEKLDLETAAWAAHWAIGGELETEAVKKVLAAKPSNNPRMGPGDKRPQYFGSLLARLTRLESHKAVVEAAPTLSKTLEIDIGWWLISRNRAGAEYKVASRWLKDDDKDDQLNGLRYLQRMPEALTGDDLKLATEAFKNLLASEDDDVVAHAILTATQCGVCKE